MFLSMLTPDEQTAFIFLAKEFIETDKVVSLKEKEILALMSREALNSSGGKATIASPDEAIKVIRSPKARSITMLEILGIAYADGEYQREERLFIQNLADEFGIAPVTLAAMENWVLRQVALNSEALDFFLEGLDQGEGC